MKLSPIVFWLFGFLLLFSCVSDKPDVVPDSPVAVKSGTGVFITNEGNFQWGNASLSFYNFADGNVTFDAFHAANNRPLGDICQSMEIHNGKAYIVVNNSGKIEVADPLNLKSIAVISGFTSPRYFAPVNDHKAYVTDLYSNSISIADLNTNLKVKEIACTGATEGLIVTNGKAYVANYGRNYVYVIDAVNDVLEDSIRVGQFPGDIRLDKYGKLWVICQNSLHRLDPVSKQEELNLSFPGTTILWKMDINGTKDTLYFLRNGIYQLPVLNSSLPPAALIEEGSSIYYGLGVDPFTGEVYVSDAIDYVQKGKVYRFRPDGTLVSSFHAGICPGDFCFY